MIDESWRHKRWVVETDIADCFEAIPQDRLMAAIEERIVDRKRLRVPVEELVQDINRYLRGWGGYFRYGHSVLHFDRISNYAFKRLALFVAKRHQRKAGYGLSVVAYWSPDRLGLISLNGTVVSPRANKPWREKPNAGGERRR